MMAHKLIFLLGIFNFHKSKINSENLTTIDVTVQQNVCPFGVRTHNRSTIQSIFVLDDQKRWRNCNKEIIKLNETKVPFIYLNEFGF